MHVFGVQPADHHWPWLEAALDQTHPYVLIVAPRESAKTTWLTNIFLPWAIGTYPLRTFAIGSVSDTPAHERMKAIRLMVEANPKWAEAFPHIKPDEKRGWSEDGLHFWDTRYTYEEWMDLVTRSGNVNTPTLFCGGVGSSIFLGKRLSGVLLCDDLMDEKNSLTALQRQRVEGWLKQVAIPTLTEGAKCIVVGTPWHRDDIIGRLRADPGWKTMRVSAEVDGKSYWPSQWPIKRLHDRRRTIGSAYYKAQYLTDPAGLSGDVFETSWFKFLPRDMPFLQYVGLGVDLAISQRDQACPTAIVTCGLDADRNLYILDMIWGRWTMNTTLKNLTHASETAKMRWGTLSMVAIEATQYQLAVVQEMLRTTTVPARAVFPDKDKVSRARPWAIRAEQGSVFVDREATWWSAFADDLVDFPNGRMDLVDAISAFWQGVSTGVGVFVG